MSSVPDLDTPSPAGLFGGLRAWLRARSNELLESPEGLTVASGADSAHPAPPANPVRVLVVDDNPVNLMLMSALMEPRGLVVTLAADGAEAVALASGTHFDLILMDLQMPILDGFGATLQIRRHESSNSSPAVPVVAFSSATPGPDALSAHGLSGSLVKPCEDEDLEDCLIRWCPTYRPASTVYPGMQMQGHWQTGRQSPADGRASAR